MFSIALMIFFLIFIIKQAQKKRIKWLKLKMFPIS